MAVDLLSDAEARRIEASSKLDPKTQTKLGQFFTPTTAAALIAGLPRLPKTGKFRILDPGAGSGSLSASILARIVVESPQLDVELVGVDVRAEPRELLADLVEELGACVWLCAFDAVLAWGW